MKFEIKNRFSGSVIFTAEIECEESESYSIKLGVAVKCAVKADANLADANLAGAYLGDANLAGAYLADANLARANLADAYLADANLAGAYLARANLADANLAGAYLAGAYLADANLAGAYLADANLAGAYLADANLARANLADAYLADANLAGAYLADANLARANLGDANLADVKRLHFQIPQDGQLTGWKKLSNGVVAKLLIPAKAKRTATPVGRKCRAEFVKTIALYGLNVESECGKYDRNTIYKVGEYTYPYSYNDDFRVECTHGIHFFLTREEAEEW